MLLPIIVIAETIAAEAAAADAKRRQELGLPPPLPAPPPTVGDKIAEALIYTLILLPGLVMASIVGISLFIALKIAFASEGISFP